MKDKSITLCPYGGLANRLRVIVSTYAITQQQDLNLKVYWFRDSGLNAKFSDLFDNPYADKLQLIEGNCLEKIAYSNPEKKNLFIPKLYQNMAFDDRVYNANSDSVIGGGYYVSACSIVGKPSFEIMHQYSTALFHLKGDILKLLDERAKTLNGYAIGFHIRRLDNAMSVRNSPTELFFEAAQKELLRHSDSTLFLATDSQDVKREFREKFPNVITNPSKADRSSKEGIIDGVLDMYMLSKCNIIYGSFYSSFSEFANIIGNNKLTVLKK